MRNPIATQIARFIPAISSESRKDIILCPVAGGTGAAALRIAKRPILTS
jgi:hypothetical protein